MDLHSEIRKMLNEKFPCRVDAINRLTELVACETQPSTVFVYGHSGTGKSSLLKAYLNCLRTSYDNIRYVYMNCVEYYATKIMLQDIYVDLSGSDDVDMSIDNLEDFMDALPSLDFSASYIIVLDNAERLRDMEANVLPFMLQLQKCGLNVCVVLVSQLPWEKFFPTSGPIDIIPIHFPQYTKAEALQILSKDFRNAKSSVAARLHAKYDSSEAEAKMKIVESLHPELFHNYINLFLSVFYKACRDLPELKITARQYFPLYIEPILLGEIREDDVSRLWRQISGPLRDALAAVYMRFNQPTNQKISAVTSTLAETAAAAASLERVTKYAESLQLPYYGKYLLIAAYLASYNSPKNDKQIFVKSTAKKRKRMQSVNAQAKVTEKLSTSVGPKSFNIDRLLAIFYAILDERVGLTCNLLSQISTLVHLKLLSFVSGENNVVEGSARLQCTVGHEFILYIGKLVGFNVRQYLCDFM